MTNSINISDFDIRDTEAVVALWQNCGLTRPWNDPYKDIQRKLTDTTGAFWLGRIGSEIVASIMIGYDGHRGSINYLAVAPDHTGTGIGRDLMARAEAFLIELECPKVAFCVRRDNAPVLAFYDHLGYGIDDVYALGKRLIPDD